MTRHQERKQVSRKERRNFLKFLTVFAAGATTAAIGVNLVNRPPAQTEPQKISPETTGSLQDPRSYLGQASEEIFEFENSAIKEFYSRTSEDPILNKLSDLEKAIASVSLKLSSIPTPTPSATKTLLKWDFPQFSIKKKEMSLEEKSIVMANSVKTCQEFGIPRLGLTGKDVLKQIPYEPRVYIMLDIMIDNDIRNGIVDLKAGALAYTKIFTMNRWRTLTPFPGSLAYVVNYAPELILDERSVELSRTINPFEKNNLGFSDGREISHSDVYDQSGGDLRKILTLVGSEDWRWVEDYQTKIDSFGAIAGEDIKTDFYGGNGKYAYCVIAPNEGDKSYSVQYVIFRDNEFYAPKIDLENRTLLLVTKDGKVYGEEPNKKNI